MIAYYLILVNSFNQNTLLTYQLPYFFKKYYNIIIMNEILVEVSARHCHLSESDIEKLFGKRYELKNIKQLSQPFDFMCKETVTVIVGSKKFEKVRVVGPKRDCSQVEMSITDVLGSGLEVPLRLSGDLKDSAPVILEGPTGKVELKEGLIISKRHIHCSIDEAEKLGLKTGDKVSVKIDSERPLIFEDVEVRIKDNYKLSMHIDTDEGNAAGINKKTEGFLVK